MEEYAPCEEEKVTKPPKNVLHFVSTFIMNDSATANALDLGEIIEDLLLVLSDKEKMVITKRFCLDNKPKQTLENIGKRFSVTRERIRQIEATALKKLQRNAHNSRIRKISEVIDLFLNENGGISNEKEIIKEVLRRLHGPQNALNGHVVRLALAITKGIQKSDSPKSFHRFWYQQSKINMGEVRAVARLAYNTLKKKGDVMPQDTLVEKIVGQMENADCSESCSSY